MLQSDCIFCKIIKGGVPSKKIYEDDNFIGILDINPKTEGHSLIISKNHFENLLDMPASLGSELIDALKKISHKLITEKKASGFNVLGNNFPSAGQEVMHFHMHLIPRKSGDGLNFFN